MTVNEKLKELLQYQAEFQYYRQGELWYRIYCDPPDGEIFMHHFDFPVPITDTGTGVFYDAMRGPELMRWIRKHLEAIEAGKKEQGL